MQPYSPPFRSPRAFRGNTAQALLTAAAIAVVVASLPAQVPAGLQFAELGKRHLPRRDDPTTALAQGDVDGDGDVDLVVGNTNAQNRLYLNDGAGIFVDATASRLPVRSDFTTSLALGDVDGDGDLDLVIGNRNQQNRLYRNDGTGTFTDATASRMPVDSDFTNAVDLGDVDGDGDLDLAIGNGTFGYGLQDRLYLNNGTGTFTDVTASRLPVVFAYTTSLAFGDVDGDGDLDLVLGSYGGQNRLYRNNGAGTFVDATVGAMPLLNGGTTSFALGDVDGDGDLDLVTGNANAQNRLYRNDGTGTFSDATAGRMPVDNDFATSLALGDVDGDGDLDLVIGNALGQRSRLYRNNGTGTFADVTAGQTPADIDYTSALALGDVDGDGDLDLVIGNFSIGRNCLYLNNGTGTFLDATGRRVPSVVDSTGALALGDVDGDGDLDLVAGNLNAQNRLYLNHGSGQFSDGTPTRLPADNDWSTSLALGDVDGDGDLDLVVGNNGQNRLYRNNGSGQFSDGTAGRMPVLSDTTNAVALGDVDRDGDLDLVVGNSAPQQNRLYLNDGTGTFADATASRMPFDDDETRSVALGDVDGDGDLDMMVGNWGDQDRLYLNNGSGTFADVTAGRLPAFLGLTSAVLLGDVDRDGDLDAVIGSYGLPGQQQNRLYLNDGSGTFSDATSLRMPVDNDWTKTIALGDVDGDGDPDLVVGNNIIFYGYGQQNRLYLNNGNGTFVDATTRIPAVLDSTLSLALGDLDGDGDLDLVTGNRGLDHLYLNLQRQLDAPHLLRPGQPYTLEAYSRYATPSVFDVALAYLSTTRLSIPIPPYGILGIDPMIPLPPVLIPLSAGVAATTFDVPNLPALAGIEVFAQAAIVPWPFDLRLTNVVADRGVR